MSPFQAIGHQPLWTMKSTYSRHGNNPSNIIQSFRSRVKCKVIWNGNRASSKVANAKSVFPASDRIPQEGLLLTPEERQRTNEQNDSLFYSVPRFIQYIDDSFNKKLQRWYGSVLKEGWKILDLCSAYDSHLPEMQFEHVTGHGMCGPELAANSALDDYFVKDLNEDPRIPLPDNSYDAVLCCMGLQYLKYPERICREVLRILKPEGKILISYTSHCFPEKTITGWLERSLDERLEMLKTLLADAGFEEVSTIVQISDPNCPDVVSDSVLTCGFQSQSYDDLLPSDPCLTSSSCDPFYASVATKPLKTSSKKLTSNEDLIDQSVNQRKSEVKRLCDQWDTLLYSHSVLCEKALSIGIPSIHLLLPDDNDTIQSLTKKKEAMRGLISSFSSSQF